MSWSMRADIKDDAATVRIMVGTDSWLAKGPGSADGVVRGGSSHVSHAKVDFDQYWIVIEKIRAQRNASEPFENAETGGSAQCIHARSCQRITPDPGDVWSMASLFATGELEGTSGTVSSGTKLLSAFYSRRTPFTSKLLSRSSCSSRDSLWFHRNLIL